MGKKKKPNKKLTLPKLNACRAKNKCQVLQLPVCEVCKKMLTLLLARKNGKFPVSPLQRDPKKGKDGKKRKGNRLADLMRRDELFDKDGNCQEKDFYALFYKNEDVKMRYYVQAHLHWFGYYYELQGLKYNKPFKTLKAHAVSPPSWVTGGWGPYSRNAYRCFIRDVSKKATSAVVKKAAKTYAQARKKGTIPSPWKATKTGDVLTSADIRLIVAMCQAHYQRPMKNKGGALFNYYLHYSIWGKVKDKGVWKDQAFVRPFILRRANITAWNRRKHDPALKTLVEGESKFVPMKEVANGVGAIGEFAKFPTKPEVVSKLEWPLRPTLETTPATGEIFYPGHRLTDSDPTTTDKVLQLPDELKKSGVDVQAIKKLGAKKYRLYAYSPDRWRISYYYKTGQNPERQYCAGRRWLGIKNQKTKITKFQWVKHKGRSFHSPRTGRPHGGIDLYADYGDPVVAVADGRIVGGPRSESVPGTIFLFVYHEDLRFTINYGEVHPESLMRMGLMIGDEVKAGQVIGAVGHMTNPARFQSSMHHFETLAGVVSSWKYKKSPKLKKKYCLNPTKFLLALRAVENSRRPKPKAGSTPGASPSA